MTSEFVESLVWDRQANAAYLKFRHGDTGEIPVARTLPVYDESGENVMATVDFASSGAVLGIELLNAAVQLGDDMKRAAERS